MRFNAKELATLAQQPSHKFDKEGILFVTEKQDGFFKQREVSTEKFCRLRGNLLFYFKSIDQFSEPQGVIVLEKFTVTTYTNNKEYDGFVFYLEFNDGLKQRLACHTDVERSDWIEAIKLASYEVIRTQMHSLREQIERKRGNRQDVDVEVVRVQQNKEIDINEIPLCEVSFQCDNLLCDAHGRPPNPSIVVHVRNSDANGWIKYGRTEIVENSSNPQFSCTFQFRNGDGLTSGTKIRFTAFDVREKISKTAVPLGSAEIPLALIQETTRIRIPLQHLNITKGFISVTSWAPEEDKKVMRSPARKLETKPVKLGHRRSQSLPPKLGVKLFVPPHLKLNLLFANPVMRTYRLQSGLGGDISVHELMAESKFTYLIPQQLLNIWIAREKELLQEISGMGELGGIWRNKQMQLLDKHLKLLKDYSQAKQNLQQCDGKFFKPSTKKADEAFEFAPINLHLQRMWAHNNTLKRSGCLDVVTVGAFTRHTGKSKTGGLIKLLHQLKDTPTRGDANTHKVQAANDAVQAIKTLRKEIVEIMSQLLLLAKTKNPKGMLPLCNEMVTKTRSLLTIWEPGLVQETFEFIEMHRIIEEPDNNSPFKKITQQLGDLDLKSPYLEDFATPMGPVPDLWPKENAETKKLGPENLTDGTEKSRDEIMSCSLPPNSFHFDSENANLEKKSDTGSVKETHFDVSGDVIENKSDENKENEAAVTDPVSLPSDLNVVRSAIPLHVFDPLDEDRWLFGHNGAFLDTKMMNSNPSANYYRPTEEPEPLDLTQLNIEASVMCLVSKIKFLCGRCGSPAVRLRQPKNVWGLGNTPANATSTQDVISNQPEATKDEINGNKLSATNNPIATDSLALTKAVGEMTRKVKKGNKFTDGLDLSLTTDWQSELRPSMKKLRQAMDGLLKTARLMHSVQRLQQDERKTSTILSIMYRRDICFSQALTTLITGLMTRLWATSISDRYISILCHLGPLAYFEGLLSLYGNEVDMWGDFVVAVEDLATVNFTLTRSNIQRGANVLPCPKVTGSRQSITVFLPVPESLAYILPAKGNISFKVTPVFFNIGINEKAAIAETLGLTREQHRSNWDNFDRLKQYHIRFKKLNLSPGKSLLPDIGNLMQSMEEALKQNVSKNVKVMQLAEDVCRGLDGLRFTSCKSAKDRTAMAVTLEQARVLQNEFHLPANDLQKVLDTMRSEGTRSENTKKNVGQKRYAFMNPSLSLPALYRPPAGTYGKVQS
ncbi:inositol polyphosphate-4-phosphatase type I A isoform X2 [Culicoides brevitarsis]|uniref:inositol polyphosphate-4-phosphatase type I A isoform X2 n=1 Tax=Culicoides brevitarsis TaxID=469753 RepID=UPI00307CAF8C